MSSKLLRIYLVASISVSNKTAKPGRADNVPWQVVATAESRHEGWSMHPMALHTRYVKLECLSTVSSKWGCSLFEFEVIGHVPEEQCVLSLPTSISKGEGVLVMQA